MANKALREQLALLYQLQERDLELLEIHQKLQDIPKQIAQLKGGVVKYTKAIEAKSAELAETEKAQRAKNAELEMNAVQREKYQTEQRTVDSNEAYSALERQIEYLNNQDEEAEEVILNLMEESDQLKEELTALEVEANKEKEKTAIEVKQLQQGLSALETERDEKLKQRKAFLPKVDQALKEKYHRWVTSRLGSSSNAARVKIGFVALGKNGICSSCRIAIQPQNLKEAQKYQKPVYCSSCKRLLYVEPATPDISFP